MQPLAQTGLDLQAAVVNDLFFPDGKGLRNATRGINCTHRTGRVLGGFPESTPQGVSP